LVSGLSEPAGIAVSGSDLFVANNISGGTIGEYTTSGATVNASLISGLSFPGGIALSGSDLLEANGNNTSNTIGEYDTSGNPINASLISGLGNPDSIEVVPEPASLSLLAICSIGLLGCRRFKRSVILRPRENNRVR
jgi:hypothetical protein